MPFIQRIIEPVFLSRPTQQTTALANDPTNSAITAAAPPAAQQTNDDFTLIANCTLANVLRQLASVVLVADEILSDLGNELHAIRHRTENIRQRIVGVEKNLENIESTIIYKPNGEKNFTDDNNVSIYKTKRTISTSLFCADTRPPHVQRMYETAAAAPVVVVCNGGEVNDNDSIVLCSVSFGHTRRHITKKIDTEIETRVPAAIQDLRKWTSSEAIGEITVSPNCLQKVGTSTICSNSTNIDNSYASFSTSYVDGIDVTSTSTNDVVDAVNDVPLDHKLPSPEEQCLKIAEKYPAEIVSVNTSNVRFERMCSIRKSLGHVPMGKTRYVAEDFQPIRRSSRGKKPSGKRRNTIAGIEDADIKEAYTQIRNSVVASGSSNVDGKSGQMPRSKSNDLLRSNGTIDSLRSSNRFSNFRALKQWGKHRLKLINKNIDARIEESSECEAGNEASTPSENTKFVRPKTKMDKLLKQDPLYSPSEKLFLNMSPTEKRCPAAATSVKLRGSMTRRQRRNQQYRCEEPNSSSGNWSASSDQSGRTSASSEVIMHNKSSTSCTSLNNNHPHKSPPITSSALSKRRITTSTSSSITSDETVPHDVPSSGYVDVYDDETSSMYSCDTEGYFTSFHVDSGLKTLKEEEIPAVPAMMSTSALLPINGSASSNLSRTTLSIESDYELFGRGSTSTTASSAGTVCTTLLGSLSNKSLVECPAAPERKSSLNSKTSNYGKPKVLTKTDALSVKNGQSEANDLSANKEVENIVSNAAPVTSDVEISENSDFEGVERVKRIRGKTLMTTNRIPSICVITPTTSDDEDRVAAMESMLSSLNINQKDLPLNDQSETVAQIHDLDTKLKIEEFTLAEILPLAEKICSEFPIEDKANDETDGEYVTITDVNSYQSNNNNIAKTLDQVLTGNLHFKTEYVSLNELPCNKNNDANVFKDGKNTKLIDGKNVKLNAHGMFVYDSSTLRYKRSLCTTFKGTSPNETSSTVSKENVETRKESDQPVVASEDKRMSAKGSPPFEKMASDSELDNDLNNGYVTLCPKKRHEVKIKTDFESVSDPELSESVKVSKSSSWPIYNHSDLHSIRKRRFSWENITKTKTSKMTKLKRQCDRISFLYRSSPVKSPPKSKSTFKTSTPLKSSDEKQSEDSTSESSFCNNTPIPAASLDKRTDAQHTTCSDRLGVPKTSLNDFKKLLLTTTNKKITTKPSAVEQLKLKQDALKASPMKILDLSSSPKSLTNRRVFQQTHLAKKNNVMSPRARWKYNNFTKNSISSIPEVTGEDEAVANDERKPTENKIPEARKKLEVEAIYATPKRKANAAATSTVTSAAATDDACDVSTETSPKTGVIETNFSLRDNIFLQTEENNFMKGEIKSYGTSVSAKMSQKPAIAAKPNEKASETASARTLETSF